MEDNDDDVMFDFAEDEDEEDKAEVNDKLETRGGGRGNILGSRAKGVLD